MTDGSVLRSGRFVLALALASTLAFVGGAINLSPAKTNPLTSITVSPAGPSVALGLSQQFTASGTYSNGNQKDLTSSVTWTSSSPSSVSISSVGLAQSLATGQVTITATSGSVSGSTVFTVNPAALVSIAVTPLSPAVVAGATQQFAASAIYTDNTSQDVTSQAVWNSALSNVATVSATGLATSIVPGITNIVATWNSVSGGSAFSVVSTPSTPVELNGSYAFSYTTLDARGAAYVAGSFHANPPDAAGDGVIDGGQQDTNTSAGVTNVVLAGPYHIYPDGRGTMVLTPAGGAGVTFEFILAASGTTANFVEFDGNATAAGSFDLQDASAFNDAALAGNLVFRLSGIDASANPMGEVGVFTADGAGNVTAGSVDVNDFGVNLATASLTGTYSVASNGRGLLTLNNGTSSSNFIFYVVEAGRLNLIASDSLPALSGITELQAARSFSNADLSQGVAYLLNRAPSATAASFDLIGRAILDGAGNITGGDQDEASTLGAQNAITGGTYSINAGGREPLLLSAAAAIALTPST